MEMWNDPSFARAWAERNTEANAERSPALDLLMRILADYLASHDVPRRALDLGCGHGVVAARVLGELPNVSLVGVDGSPPMLELARERLAPYADRVSLAQADFETMTPSDLAADPAGGPFGVAFAVQAIHNCSDEGKRRALESVSSVLAPRGLFLLLDRIRLATPALFGVYRSIWDLPSGGFYDQRSEGRTFEEHDRLRAERGDQPGSLEQNLLWLREAGFAEVAAVQVVGVRALIAAITA